MTGRDVVKMSHVRLPSTAQCRPSTARHTLRHRAHSCANSAAVILGLEPEDPATSVVSAWWLRRKDESTLAGFVFRALEPCWWRAQRSDVIDRGLDPVLSKDGKGLDVIFDPAGIEDMAVNEAVAVRCSFEAAAVRVSR